MGQRLIGLPVSVGMRAARLGLRAARLPLDVVGGLMGRGGDRNGSEGEVPGTYPEVKVPGTESDAKMPGTTPGAAARAEAASPVAPRTGPEEPEHVSEEPELVAEAGAVEAVSAEVDVAEPWEGYARMTVRDVEQRLATATAEEVAVVQLYEQTHRARQSVLRAAERRLTRQAAERRRP